MITANTVEVFYSYFYVKKYRDHKYKFKRTKTTTSVVESFLKLIDKEYSLHCVGETFLWEYFLFQFNYWHDLTIKNFNESLVISYIVGKKAFERWKTRDKEYDWQIESYPIIGLYGVQKSDLFTKTEQPDNQKSTSKAIRKLFHNTEKGFAICVEMTTLFDPKDTACILCMHRSDCKELLRSNYPNIYKSRGLNG